MRLIFMVLIVVMLSGCLATGSKVTDFSDRSVGYGWLDIKKIDANRLHSVVVYQYQPKIDKPYFHVAVKKFQGGYLYYAFSFPVGSFGAYSATGQNCLTVLCSNTIYTYEFGRQGGDVAAVRMGEPGVYSFGSYALQEVKTGFFQQGKFEAVPVEGPTHREMLEEILKDAKGNAVIQQRLTRALQAL